VFTLFLLLGTLFFLFSTAKRGDTVVEELLSLAYRSKPVPLRLSFHNPVEVVPLPSGGNPGFDKQLLEASFDIITTRYSLLAFTFNISVRDLPLLVIRQSSKLLLKELSRLPILQVLVRFHLCFQGTLLEASSTEKTNLG
jgi:hypothetical protein